MSQLSPFSNSGSRAPHPTQLFDSIAPITFDPADFQQGGWEVNKELTDDVSPVQYPCFNAGTCPDCGAGMVRLGVCYSCPCCGFGGCSA
jgi:hypothetical protein